MTPRYRFSERRREKMDPPEVVGAPCHFTTVNKSWREVSFSPNAPSKGRAKGKRARKRAHAPRQTKADIKREAYDDRSERYLFMCALFRHRHGENTSTLCYTVYMSTVCAFAKRTENIFDFISNGRSPPSAEKYRFYIYIYIYIYICLSDKSDFSIDNKSCARNEMRGSPWWISKMLLLFPFFHFSLVRARIKLSLLRLPLSKQNRNRTSITIRVTMMPSTTEHVYQRWIHQKRELI